MVPLDLFGDLAQMGGEIIASAWVAICMAIWNAGLWSLELQLSWVEAFMTPNLDPGEDSTIGVIYGYTLWIAMVIALIAFIAQLILTVLKRDGKTLGETLLGAVKFLIVASVWYTYCGGVVVAAAAINTALRKELLGEGTTGILQEKLFTIDEAAVTHVLGSILLLLGLLLWLGTIAYFIVMVGRAVTILVLVATAPIAAAGLMHKPLSSWFWKSFRWFHAAAIAPILMTLMLGMGVQLASGVAMGLEDGAGNAVATAIPGVLMVVISAVSPVALFKLLAFVDPGTSSGASFRAGLTGLNATQGGLERFVESQRTSESHSSASATTEGGSRALASTTTPTTTSAAAGGVSGAGTASTAGTAGASGAAAGLGPVGIAALGAAKLVGAFKQAGASAAGMVTDTAVTMGAGDASFAHDPGQDVRAAEMQRTRPNPTPPTASTPSAPATNPQHPGYPGRVDGEEPTVVIPTDNPHSEKG